MLVENETEDTSNYLPLKCRSSREAPRAPPRGRCVRAWTSSQKEERDPCSLGLTSQGPAQGSSPVPGAPGEPVEKPHGTCFQKPILRRAPPARGPLPDGRCPSRPTVAAGFALDGLVSDTLAAPPGGCRRFPATSSADGLLVCQQTTSQDSFSFMKVQLDSSHVLCDTEQSRCTHMQALPPLRCLYFP